MSAPFSSFTPPRPDGNFFTGTPESFQQISTLPPDQRQLFSQLVQMLSGNGGGGTFGDIGDYYKQLLAGGEEDFDRFARPEMRQFEEQTIPSLARQFAGMGSGGLSSGAFARAGAQAGSNLQERLAALRAQLRGQGAEGLQNLGKLGFQNVSQTLQRPEQPGFLQSTLFPALGAAGGSFFGPFGTAAGGALGKSAGDYFFKGSTPATGAT